MIKTPLSSLLSKSTWLSVALLIGATATKAQDPATGPEEHPGESSFFLTVGTEFELELPLDVGQTATLPSSFDGETFALPPGLSYDSSSLLLGGSPTESGIYETLVLVNEISPTGVLEENPHLIVFLVSDDPSTGAPKLSRISEVEFTAGTTFTYGILASGDPTTYGAEDLPPELALNPDTGEISGLIGGEREFFFIVQAGNASGNAYGIQILDIYQPGTAEDDPDSTTGPKEDYEPFFGRVGVPFELRAPDDYVDATFALAAGQSFPGGLDFDSEENGVISGTPTAEGLFRTELQITRGSDIENVGLRFFITDSDAAPQFASERHVHVTPGEPFDIELIYANGPATLSLESEIPGTSFDPTEGVLEGTIDEPGRYDALVLASSENGYGIHHVEIDVFEGGSGGPGGPGGPAHIVGKVGESLFFQMPFSLSGVGVDFGTNPDGTPSLPPPGIDFNATEGAFIGVPQVPGFFHFTLLISEGGDIREEHFQFDIFDPFIGEGPPPINVFGDVGIPMEMPIFLPDDIVGPVIESLPEGLSFVADTLTIVGTPVTPGFFEATLVAQQDGDPINIPVFVEIFGDFGPGGPGGPGEEFKIHGWVGEFLTFPLPYDPATTVVSIPIGPTGLPPVLPTGVEFDATHLSFVGFPQDAGFFEFALALTEGGETRTVPVFFDIQFHDFGGGDPGSPHPEFHNQEASLFLEVGTRFSLKLDLKETDSIEFPEELDGQSFALPTGLTFNSETNAIVGTPTTSGIFESLAFVEKTTGVQEYRLLFLVSDDDEDGAPRLSFYSEAEYVPGTAFDVQILAAGDPTSFAVEDLPDGASVDAGTGVISGQLDFPEEFDLIVSATNANGTAYGILFLDAEFDDGHDGPGGTGDPTGASGPGDPAGPGSEEDEVEESPEPIFGRVGVPFGLNAPAEFASATFELADGEAFPAGISFDSSSTFTISGTPTEEGLFKTVIRVIQEGESREVALSFFIADSVAAPQFVSRDYLRVLPGEPIELPVRIANGPATITLGHDVPGLNYDADAKVLRGILTEFGFRTVTLLASSDNGYGVHILDIDVFDDGSGFPGDEPPPPMNVFGVVGQPIDFPLPADPLRSEIVFGAGEDGTPSQIPPGLEFVSDFAIIRGIPEVDGFFDVFLEITEFGFTRREHVIFEIYKENDLPDDFPTDPGVEEPDDGHVEPILGKVGERLYFEAPISGEGVSFELVTGPDGEDSELPPGISFDAELGIISGVPTLSGIYPVWVKVDEFGHVRTHFAPIIVSGPVGSPEIVSLDFISTFPGEHFSHLVEVTNDPSTVSVDFFDVPGILNFDPETLILEGKFDFGGFFTLLIKAENDTGVGYGLLHIDVLGLGDGGDGTLPPAEIPLFINGTAGEELDWELPSFIRGSSFVISEDPGGFETRLPEGLSMSEVNGRITGTPVHPGFSFVFVKVDDGELPSLALNIGVAPGLPTPIVISPNFWVGHQERPFEYWIHATDFPFAFSATGLPDGLIIDTRSGRISGTPTVSGEFEVELRAENEAGQGEAMTLFLFIEEQPRFPVVSAPFYTEGEVGSALEIQVNATENPDSFHATGLPFGLEIHPVTGLISGTPLVPGYFPVRVEAFNASGHGSASLAILVKRAAAAPVYVGPSSIGGKVGEAFSFHLPFNNEVTSISFHEASPNPMPAGLLINPSTGEISGVPTETFFGQVQFVASGPGGTTNAYLYIRIVPALNAPVVNSTPFASGTTGQGFEYQITASNDPVEFEADNLPDGLGVDTSTGLISGTPIEAGYADVYLRARNASGWSKARLVIFDILPGLEAPTIVSAPYARGQVGQSFSFQVEATNNPTQYVSSRDLPGGLTLDPNTGAITGTPTEAGLTETILSAANASGFGNGMVFFISIKPSLEMPRIISSGTAFGKVGEPFLYQIKATAEPTSYKAENLPAGLSLNATTGFITGTPTEPTDEPVILVVSASNASGSSLPRAVFLEILPSAQAPEILGGSFLLGKVGENFEFQVFATNEPTNYFSPNLPQGLSINSSTGLISGEPEVAGEFIVELQASNEAGTGDPAVIIIFVLPGANMPRVTSAPYAKGKVGDEFSYQILASEDDVTFGVDGNLPRGLDFDPTTGIIGGTPVEPSLVSVYLTATNDAGTSLPQPLTIKIEPSLEAPVIVSSLRVRGMVGEDFEYQIDATNMPDERPLPPSAEFDAIGLPSGLGVNNATGIISGTPEEAGIFVVTLAASNASGDGQSKFLLMSIDPALDAPVVFGATRVSAQVGKSFDYRIRATNTPTSYDAEHAISWLSVNTSTGDLTGTPDEPGEHTVGLFATNDSGTSDPGPLVIVVYPAADTPKIVSERSATGKIGEVFSYAIEATNTPTSYKVSGLPAGLSLNSSTGLISGTPTASGTFEISMVASNANGEGAQTELVLVISPRQEITIIVP